jgi:hypothetical protein
MLIQKQPEKLFLIYWGYYKAGAKIWLISSSGEKQIEKSHVVDIFTSEDMENISHCVFFSISLST